MVFDLIEVNGSKETLLVDSMSYSDFNEKRIWVNTVTRDTTTEHNITYELRMWLSDDVLIFIANIHPYTNFCKIS